MCLRVRKKDLSVEEKFLKFVVLCRLDECWGAIHIKTSMVAQTLTSDHLSIPFRADILAGRGAGGVINEKLVFNKSWNFFVLYNFDTSFMLM